ncbi:MAG: hypothetical protein E7652_05735 [Ruminococcaceae bacterium]|nr:hypothetical protein [Oscillospiraceae bacterium]
MRPEKLHDALNYLDDDLIESADIRRNNSSKAKPWLKILPLAACFCIITVAAFAAYNSGYFDSTNISEEPTETENKSGYKEELAPSLPSENEGIPDEAPPPDKVTKNESVIIESADGESDMSDNIESESESEELPSFGVSVFEWTEDGFNAVISEITDTEIFPVGTKIKVIFDDRCNIGIKTENGYKIIEKQPSEKDFPIGTKATVLFYDLKETDDNIILYSSMIYKEESK